MTATIVPVLAREDVARLTAVMALIGANDTESVLATALPSLDGTHLTALAGHTCFSHAAVLIFPSTFDALREELAHHGVETGAMTPSVVVRNRLSVRYGVPSDALDVRILRAPVTDLSGRACEVEIFAMATPPELAHIADDERRHGRENHIALAVPDADPIVLNGLRTALATDMRPDGGGYNSHENATVLYFRDAHHHLPEFHRLELICAGRFTGLLAQHQRESAAGTHLLRLMTGAWATQAIATAAELHLADHLATTPDLPGLAAATGADQDSLGRLLRYLATLGLVRTTATGHVLTELGELLRSDVDGSLRPLALMYGGPFYQSFAALPAAVRTGEESYRKVFGAHHFDHMAANPDLASLFHQSMAASNSVFTELVRVIDFSAARTVVDIAGGKGELLARILTANPALHGILLERPHARPWPSPRWPRSPPAAPWFPATSPRPCPRSATSTSCPASCTTGTTSSAAPSSPPAPPRCRPTPNCWWWNGFCRRSPPPTRWPCRGTSTCSATWAVVKGPSPTTAPCWRTRVLS